MTVLGHPCPETHRIILREDRVHTFLDAKMGGEGERVNEASLEGVANSSWRGLL